MRAEEGGPVGHSDLRPFEGQSSGAKHGPGDGD